MKYLLDTRTFLWWCMDPEQLSARAHDLIADGSNDIYFSAASAWEIAIKAGKGRLILPEDPERYVISRMSQNRFLGLPIQIVHTLRVFSLPPFHSDPFDRLLIAQSKLESLPLITKDEGFQRYEVETVW